MSGSLKWFIYEANSGVRYSFLIDESKGKAQLYNNNGLPIAPLFPPIASPLPGRAPKGFVMRQVSCVGFYSTNSRRKFWVGTKEAFELLQRGGQYLFADGDYWAVVGVKEERLPRPFIDPNYIDTGLTDGGLS